MKQMRDFWNALKNILRPYIAPLVEKSLEPIWKLGFALAVNNNVRMMCFWGLTGTLTILYVLLFGVITPLDTSSFVDGATQRYENLYLYGEFQSDTERGAYSWFNPLWWIVVGPWRLFVWIVRFLFKWIIRALWIWTPPYSLWALRDELAQAWEAAAEAILVTKSIEENLPNIASATIQTATTLPGAPQAATQTPHYLTFRDYLRWEFIVTFFSELLEIIFTQAQARRVTAV